MSTEGQMNSIQEHLPTSAVAGTLGSQVNRTENNESLLEKIKQQIEYYFSNQNLPNDKFLKKLVEMDSANQGYVPLEVICNFNKIKQLTNDLAIVRKAIQSSTMVAISADGHSLRRSSELPSIEHESDKKTIYVSKIPKECDKEALRTVFSDFGKVMRIDLPTDKKSGDHKGIAFIEFNTEEEFHQALRSTDKHKFAVRPFKPKSKKESQDDKADKPAPVQTDQNNKTQNEEQKKDTQEKKKKKNNKKKKDSKRDSGELKGKEATGRDLDFARNSVYDAKSAWKHNRRLHLESNGRTKLHQFNLPPFVPCRNPFGPSVDGSRGFSAGRGRIMPN